MNLPLLDHYCYPLDEHAMETARRGEGQYGEPPRPDCYPHGYMTEHYNCSCWDDTIYKGPTCKESCVRVGAVGSLLLAGWLLLPPCLCVFMGV